jgi:hypothetical protein
MNRAVQELVCDRGYDTRKCRNHKFAIQLATEMQLVAKACLIYAMVKKILVASEQNIPMIKTIFILHNPKDSY